MTRRIDHPFPLAALGFAATAAALLASHHDAGAVSSSIRDRTSLGSGAGIAQRASVASAAGDRILAGEVA